MATANIQSERQQNIRVSTSLVTDERNNAETNATTETNLSGIFVTPSTVAGRAADVTGFPVTSATSLGKWEFTTPETLFNTVSLGDLSDVELTDPSTGNYLQYDGTNWVNASVSLDELDDVILTNPTTNQIITYDGTDWVNSSAVTLTGDLTVEGNTALGTNSSSLFGMYGAAAIGRPAPNTSGANFVADTSGITDGTAEYETYTVGGLVLVLQSLGVLS